jgi:hypothetical protein
MDIAAGFRLLDSAEIRDLWFKQFAFGMRERSEPKKYRVLSSWVYLVRAGQGDSKSLSLTGGDDRLVF